MLDMMKCFVLCFIYQVLFLNMQLFCFDLNHIQYFYLFTVTVVIPDNTYPFATTFIN